MRKGFFGGTFDPIHFGHLNLAIQMLERHGLDEVLFCPTSISPLKRGEPPSASNRHRRRMVALAIKPIKKFKIIDLEIEKEGVCYTIDTIRHLKEGKKDHYNLILGEDVLPEFPRWKEVEELVALAPPLIGSRPADPALAMPPVVKAAVLKGMTKIPLMDISSTELRERLRQKLFCGHLIPMEVLDYIHQNQLYSN